VLVNCKDKEKVAEKLRYEFPDIEEDVAVLTMMYVKKPPGAKPWGAASGGTSSSQRRFLDV
jgi:acyl-coenzyme A thioesterase PaaI-like protein